MLHWRIYAILATALAIGCAKPTVPAAAGGGVVETPANAGEPGPTPDPPGPEVPIVTTPNGEA